MSYLQIADSYAEAERIIDKAEIATVDIHPVWEKLYRVKKYLRQQSKAELAEILSEVLS